jgi:GR25 family glycosyltransferase involved in LPS biosynthesis
MKTIAITLRNSDKIPRLEEHLKNSGISEYQIFYGINGPKSGLATTIPFDIDSPGSGYKIGPTTLGCTLSHWNLWNTLDFQSRNGDTTEFWMVVEDDVLFKDGWKNEVESAIKDAPPDWDMIFPGSCCLGGRIKSTIRAGLVEAWPLCTHCYIVRKKALKTLIETNEEQYGPIDVQLYFKSFPNMKIYAIDPRVADQFETFIV